MGSGIFGVDFGGSNLRIAMVDADSGELLEEPYARALDGVLANGQLSELVMRRIPSGSRVGICAAGNVDEKRLVVLESPNSLVKGEITFGRELAERGCIVSMTNDVKAAALAAARFGEGRGSENVLLATYSSGFNCAVVRAGLLATSAEFGHMPYPREPALACGCGGRGHIEAYVSGNGAAAMAREFFKAHPTSKHPILDAALAEREKAVKRRPAKNEVAKLIRSKHVYAAYRADPKQEPQKSIRELQVRAIADSLGMMNSAYHPLDVMLLMGGQTKDWPILFEPAIELYHKETLQLPSLPKPPVLRVEMREIGVRGAVAYFASQHREI